MADSIHRLSIGSADFSALGLHSNGAGQPSAVTLCLTWRFVGLGAVERKAAGCQGSIVYSEELYDGSCRETLC